MRRPAERPTPPAATIGLFGKLPARGDFVRLRLPRSFTDSWDEWWQRSLAHLAARTPDEDWRAAWDETPAWRFSLPPGICGPDPVLGIWRPSLDAAERRFSLTLACLPSPGWDPSFLDTLAPILDLAVEGGLSPDQVAAALPPTPTPTPGSPLPAACRFECTATARIFAFEALPEPAVFAAMIEPGQTACATDATRLSPD